MRIAIAYLHRVIRPFTPYYTMDNFKLLGRRQKRRKRLRNEGLVCPEAL
jgi:hypothetical protein